MAMPTGICTAAKAKKKALDKSPVWRRRKGQLPREIVGDDADGIAQELADRIDRRQGTNRKTAVS